MLMQTITPGEIPHRDMHQILLSGVAPRPIALVATINPDGSDNLAPFSFFNAYASKPPVLAIGPAISAATGKAKDTYLNLLDNGECTVNAVTYAMTEQISLASCDYERGTDEFFKAGLTKRPSELVKAHRVAESPFQMECTLMESIPLRRDIGGNGNIMLLEVKKLHVAENVFTDGRIDPQKLDLAARMGYDFYCRAHGSAIYEVKKPRWNGIGIDVLPEEIRMSTILTGNELALLAGVREMPQFSDTQAAEINQWLVSQGYTQHESALGLQIASDQKAETIRIHTMARKLIQDGHIDKAWFVLMN
jgi:flavin reductase (DIM6/NTAB) family NADH-FMN oxidoreductase RutF